MFKIVSVLSLSPFALSLIIVTSLGIVIALPMGNFVEILAIVKTVRIHSSMKKIAQEQ